MPVLVNPIVRRALYLYEESQKQSECLFSLHNDWRQLVNEQGQLYPSQTNLVPNHRWRSERRLDGPGQDLHQGP